jgi:hypothetical protein
MVLFLRLPLKTACRLARLPSPGRRGPGAGLSLSATREGSEAAQQKFLYSEGIFAYVVGSYGEGISALKMAASVLFEDHAVFLSDHLRL